jgi:hypothetical protein
MFFFLYEQTHTAGTALLSSIGIANGDSLTVRETAAPAPAAVDTALAAATPAAVSNTATEPGLPGFAGLSNGAYMGVVSLRICTQRTAASQRLAGI